MSESAVRISSVFKKLASCCDKRIINIKDFCQACSLEIGRKGEVPVQIPVATGLFLGSTLIFPDNLKCTIAKHIVDSCRHRIAGISF